ncbi:40S small subunit processome assembly factor 1 [Festucalex cinctus]
MKPDVNGKVDEDCAFLEQVLDTLYDFGSGAVKKKKKKKRCEQEAVPEEPANICSFDEDQNGGQESPEVTVHNPGPAVKPVRQVEVVHFQDPTKRQKTTKRIPAVDETIPLETSEKKQTAPQQGLSLNKARLEVHLFGITGYKKEQQRVFEEERAIMLGARPAKKSYMNYKALQQQIKEKKQKAKEEVQPELKKKKNPSRDSKKTATSGSSSAPTGQVGRFKDGILILSPKDIKSIKGRTQRK